MFNILKDSNGKFNKRNILPILGISISSVIMLSIVGKAIPLFFSHPSLSNDPDHHRWDHEKYSEFFFNRMQEIIIVSSTLGLYTYLSIDNIRQNKKIETLKANSEPHSHIYNPLVSDVLEEQSRV